MTGNKGKYNQTSTPHDAPRSPKTSIQPQMYKNNINTSVKKVNTVNDKVNCTIGDLSKGSNTQLTRIGVELAAWREALTLEQVQQMCSDKNNDITVAVLNAGAGVCTYASIRAGMRPVWYSEVNKKQSNIYNKMTNNQATCIGDTFQQPKDKYKDIHDGRCLERPVHLSTGMPCPNYSWSGDQKGEYGETGWQFTEQVDIILQIRPYSFRLEISEHIWDINDGREIWFVINKLKQVYVVKWKVISVIEYMDPSSRKRTFVVGFLKQLGAVADMFEWPLVICNEDCSPCARDVAIPDSEVPTEYWRYDEPKRVRWQSPESGKLHWIACLVRNPRR